MATEYVTLPRTASAGQLTGLLQIGGGARLSVRQGQDAAGQSRSIIEVTHEDSEIVALTRQNLLRACQQANIRAFVV